MERSRYRARITELMSLRGATSEATLVITERILDRQGFVDVFDLAFLLDATVRTVENWCKAGRIPARKVARVWHIGLEGLFYEKKR